MSDKIEYNDLFAPDTFTKAVEGMEKILASFNSLQNEFKETLLLQKQFQEGFKVKSYDDIKKLNDAIAQAEKTLNDYNNATNASKQAEIELAKLRQQQAKALQEEEKAQQAKIRTEKLSNSTKEKTLSLYQQESKRLNDLRKEFKELALQEKGASEEAKKLLVEITKLDAKLKNVDASVGQFQRNVGNYTGALDTFRTGVTNVLGAAGIGVGISEGISFLKDSVGEFSKLESSLKNLQAITGVSSEELKFFKQNAEELGINVKGGAVAVVEAYKLIGSAKPELLENKDALNDVTKSAILLSQAAGLELPDAATRLTDALNQYGASADQAAKFTDVLANGAKFGAAEVPQVTDALLKFGVAAKSSNISIQESVGAIELLAEKGLKGAEAGTALRNVFAKLSAAKALPKEAIKELEQAGVNINVLSDSSLSLNDRLKELSKISGDATAITKVFGLENKTAGEILISNLPRLNNLTLAVNANGAALEQASINTDTFANKQLRLENTFISLKSAIGEYIVNGLNEAITGYDLLTGKIDAVDLRLSKLTETFTNNAKLFIQNNKVNEFQLELQKKSIEVLNDESLSLAEKNEQLLQIAKQVNILTNEVLKAKKPTQENIDLTNEETKTISNNTKAVQKNKEIRKEANDEREDENKKRKQEADDLKKFEDTRRNLDDESQDARKKLEEERIKAAEEEKKRREDELKELADMAGKVLSIAEKEIKEKEKLRQEALDKEISDRENNIERQRELADKGLANTLAFEEKALAEAERRKEDEAKKALKREKTLAFFKLFAANAEKDPNNALQKTIVETFLAEAVAGSFFKGTEKVEKDLQGNKVHNGRDGYVVAVDGSERVLTGKQNELIGNMSNEDLAKLAYDYQNGLLPKYAITDSMNANSMSKNITDSLNLHQLVSINKNLEELNHNIKNQKETSYAIDNLGNVLRYEIQNGIKRLEINKRGRI